MIQSRHSLDPLGQRCPLGVQQISLTSGDATVAVVQRIGRLVHALGQQLVDAHIVGRFVVLAEAHPLQNEVNDGMADALREEAGLLLVEADGGDGGEMLKSESVHYFVINCCRFNDCLC